jgi:hypothetical protein
VSSRPAEAICAQDAPIHLDHPIDGYRFPSKRRILSDVEHKILAMTIPAKIRSDDWAKYAEFDASTWFATAPTEKILELARNGWGDNELSNEAAKDCAGSNGAVADVLQYVMYLRHGGLRGGCKCVVSSVAALEWLAYHRPEVLEMLRASQYRPVERVAV